MSLKTLKENVKQIDKNNTILRDLVDRESKNKCAWCGHTLFLGHLGNGSLIEVKCPQCRECTPFGVQK